MPEHDGVLHLRTLGSLDLPTTAAPNGDLLLAQPRSVALLIYLLLARPRGYLRRDVLCVLFWPDADEHHARGALSQALTRIRHSAGSDVLQPRGKEEIRIRRGAVSCDVVEFERAAALGDYQTALNLYTGDFLAGFHAPNMDGFERWAEAERGRLRSIASRVARGLAVRNVAAGRLPEGEWAARRALELAPDSEAVATELVRAVAAAGDPVCALCLYDAWAAGLTREFELTPSESGVALARELRAHLGVASV